MRLAASRELLERIDSHHESTSSHKAQTRQRRIRIADRKRAEAIVTRQLHWLVPPDTQPDGPVPHHLDHPRCPEKRSS